MNDIAHAEFLVEHPVARGKASGITLRGEGGLAAGLLPGRHAAPAGAIAAALHIAELTAPGKSCLAGAAERDAAAKPLCDILDNRLGRQFLNKARGNGGLPLAVYPAAAGKAQMHLLARTGDADIGEPPLFLEADGAILVDGPLAREDALFPAGKEDGVELQPLGRVKRHQHDLALLAVSITVHHQRDMLDKALQRIEILHSIDKLGQILQPPLRIGRAVRLPHAGIAGFIQHHLRKIGMVHACRGLAPAANILAEPAKRVARRRAQLVGRHKVDGSRHQGFAG